MQIYITFKNKKNQEKKHNKNALLTPAKTIHQNQWVLIFLHCIVMLFVFKEGTLVYVS